MLQEIITTLGTTFWMILGILGIFAIYLAVSGVCSIVYNMYMRGKDAARGYTSLKTVTFGDESAVTGNRAASVAAVVTLFLFWGIATGSKLLPPILPGPFVGDASFSYTATNAAGQTADATVYVRVHEAANKEAKKPEFTETATGFAKSDAIVVPERRTKIIKVQSNDDGGTEDGFKITAVNGQAIAPNQAVTIDAGEVFMTRKGSLSVRPASGLTMEALYLPPPEQAWKRFLNVWENGYLGVGLWENVTWSLIRVVFGFALGCLFGIPLGFAMGLNSWLRGWFEPIVEFMRPVPPLALIPLIIIWFGIGEQGKISLLFLAALWIMTIAARAGVSGVNIAKIHAAYSLGATKKQILSKVILPNSLPEIFTGARVAMGVCWGTVVAAELVAAEKGAGKMIIAASKFQLTDIVIIGIIIIGIIGYGIDVLMRMAENKLVPWKGRG